MRRNGERQSFFGFGESLESLENALMERGVLGRGVLNRTAEPSEAC